MTTTITRDENWALFGPLAQLELVERDHAEALAMEAYRLIDAARAGALAQQTIGQALMPQLRSSDRVYADLKALWESSRGLGGPGGRSWAEMIQRAADEAALWNELCRAASQELLPVWAIVAAGSCADAAVRTAEQKRERAMRSDWL